MSAYSGAYSPAFDTAPAVISAVPTTDEVRQWCQAAKTSITDEQLEQVITAELQNQADACTVPASADDYPAVLAQSLYRRVARHLAGRQVPLGIVGDGAEYGPATLATFDAEVERLEGPRRMVVFG